MQINKFYKSWSGGQTDFMYTALLVSFTRYVDIEQNYNKANSFK